MGGKREHQEERPFALKISALKALNNPRGQVENRDFYLPASIKVFISGISGNDRGSLDFHSGLEVYPLQSGITGDLMKNLDSYHH